MVQDFSKVSDKDLYELFYNDYSAIQAIEGKSIPYHPESVQQSLRDQLKEYRDRMTAVNGEIRRRKLAFLDRVDLRIKQMEESGADNVKEFLELQG